MAAAPRAPFPNNVGDNAPAGDRRLERRLQFHAAVYVVLGTSSLLRAAVPLADSHVFVGFALWTAAVALAVLSFHLRRFPTAAMAAARLAQAALRAFF